MPHLIYSSYVYGVYKLHSLLALRERLYGNIFICIPTVSPLRTVRGINPKWKHKRVCTMHHFTIHLHTIFYRQDEACEENACPAGNLDRVRIPNEMKKERNEGVTLLEC